MKTENEEVVRKRIAVRLKKLRIEKGYTNAETFAFRNELPRVQYWRMETGEKNYTIDSLLRVLNAHGITIEEFFGDKHEDKSSI